MLPLGLPFQETIDETSKVAAEHSGNFRTVLVCIGSGTICAGVIKGMLNPFKCGIRKTTSPRPTVYGVMSRHGLSASKRRDILAKAEIIEHGLLGNKIKFQCIDPGWQYTDRCDVEVPFPCHPYYDAKAWQWLIENIDQLEDPILFWNIGS